MWMWTWWDDLRPILDIISKRLQPNRRLWPYKDVDAHEKSRCEELQAITFTFHRPGCAWVQVQNIVLTKSQRIIVLLLSNFSWYRRSLGDLLYLGTHANKQIFLALLHSLTHTHCSCCCRLKPVRILKFCEHKHDFSLHWHLLREQWHRWDIREWREGFSSYWWMGNKWKTESTDKAEACVRQQKRTVIRVRVEHSSSMRDYEAEQQERFAPQRTAYLLSAFKVKQLSLPDSACRYMQNQSGSCTINTEAVLLCEENMKYLPREDRGKKIGFISRGKVRWRLTPWWQEPVPETFSNWEI